VILGNIFLSLSENDKMEMGIKGFSRRTPCPFGTPLSRGEFFPFHILLIKQDRISLKSIVLYFLTEIYTIY